MAKPGKAAAPAKASKPPLKAGNKRKGDAGLPAAAPPAKKVRADDGKGSNSDAQKKTSSKDKRAAVREKKLLHKKNWNIIQDAVYLWEKLRPKETPDAERMELVSDILKKVTGKLLELSNHHTASRVIQFCVKYGGDAERRKVMEEVRANVVELSRSKYGHFLVRKLINAAKKDEVSGLVRLFRGHVAQLLRQPYGADVITDLYDVASAADRNALCSEFYGKEYVLFDGVSGEAGRLYSLKQLMAAAPPAKQRAIVLHMSKSLLPIMEKALLHPPMTHRLVKEYLECAPGLSVEDAVETLSQTGEAVLRMVHTHEGATAACMVLAYGTPRDRKRLVRAMKGHVGAMAADEWAHSVLCMALGCVDDTALTGKVLVPEIKDLLAEAVHQATGVRVLLQLLAPTSRRHFPPAIYDILHPPQRIVRGSSGKSVTDVDGEEDEALDFGVGAADGDDDGDGDDLFTAKKDKGAGKDKKADKSLKPKAAASKGGKDADAAGGSDEPEEDADGEGAKGAERVLGASKKDPLLRRKELLGSGPKSLSAKLTQVAAEAASDLLRSAHGCELVVEVARGGEQGLLYQLEPAGVRAVQSALVEDAARSPEEVAAEADPEGNGDAEAEPSTSGREHIFLSYYSSRALRRLLLAAEEEGANSGAATAFAQDLWEGALKGRCKQWIGTHAEKVLAALLHCGVPSVVEAASKELKGLVKQPFEEWASKFLTHKGGNKDGGQRPAPKTGQGPSEPAGAGPGPGSGGTASKGSGSSKGDGKQGKGGKPPVAEGVAPDAVGQGAEAEAEGSRRLKRGNARATAADGKGKGKQVKR